MSKVLKIGIPIVALIALVALYATHVADAPVERNAPVQNAPRQSGTSSEPQVQAGPADTEAAAIEAEMSALVSDGARADEGLNDQPVSQEQ